jgi:hypothetical protein
VFEHIREQDVLAALERIRVPPGGGANERSTESDSPLLPPGV